MSLMVTFICLVFLYGLFSERIERTVITAPILFTTAGMLMFLFLPDMGENSDRLETFLLLAEVGLVYLEQEMALPGEATIQLALMLTVLLSIFAHGLSAMPGMSIYTRKIAKLPISAPELEEVETKTT